MNWKVKYSLRQQEVQALWQEIIVNYLQPYNCLQENICIEIRNDNDSRFLAKKVQDFFAKNNLAQVFTHPYTPQENGHIESFYAILSRKIDGQCFWSMRQLEVALSLFYEKYNLHRIHASIAYLSPMNFWKSWEYGWIQTKVNEKRKTVKHKLKIPYQEILQRIENRKKRYFRNPRNREI